MGFSDYNVMFIDKSQLAVSKSFDRVGFASHDQVNPHHRRVILDSISYSEIKVSAGLVGVHADDAVSPETQMIIFSDFQCPGVHRQNIRMPAELDLVLNHISSPD
jgi:hypothetical protein